MKVIGGGRSGDLWWQLAGGWAGACSLATGVCGAGMLLDLRRTDFGCFVGALTRVVPLGVDLWFLVRPPPRPPAMSDWDDCCEVSMSDSISVSNSESFICSMGRVLEAEARLPCGDGLSVMATAV